MPRAHLYVGLFLVVSATSATSRDFVDCGGVEFISIDAKSGRVLGTWTTPGLGAWVGPFMISADQKKVYAGIQTCQGKDGKAIRSGVLSSQGRLVPTSVTLSVPELHAVNQERPDPTWEKELEPLPQSDSDAVVSGNRMLFYDKTGGAPILKYIDLQFKPNVQILSRMRTDGHVRDLILGRDHALVFLDELMLSCFDISGKLVWTWAHDGPDPSQEAGPGTEIRIYEDGDQYIVTVNHAGLYALDKATGKVRWKVPYFNIYASPSIIKAGGNLVLGPVAR